MESAFCMAFLKFSETANSRATRGVLPCAVAFMLAACLFFVPQKAHSQINTDQMLRIGRNALYFEDYVLSIQYFNAVIGAKPYLAQPYFYRGLAKFYLDDLNGADADATLALDRNPFIGDAYELRGIVRQNLGHVAEAIADYDSALAMAPHNRGLLFNKAMAQAEAGQYAAADSTYTTLLRYFPGYAEGYLGRARMNLARNDTVAASADIDHALEIDHNSVNGYVMRADIAINSEANHAQALEDMNNAIRLQPKYAGFYINRAYLRHEMDDYAGAMDDYDYALQLDPLNTMAMFNRAMLRAEVHDFNRAVDDLNNVEALKGADFRVLYNRAIINKDLRDYDGALSDIDRVIDAYPDLAAAYFLRFDIKRAKGDRTAQSDYDRSIALAKKRVQVIPGSEGSIDIIAAESGEGETQEAVANRFTRLMTIDDNSDIEREFNHRTIRGRVQDNNVGLEIEPLFVATYYNAPTEIKQASDYIREVNELNASRALRFILQVTNREPRIDDPDDIQRHFASADYYTSYISTHTPRPVDYFARGMDYLTLRNYQAAIADFTAAIAAQPEFTLAWFMRGVARYKELHAPVAADDEEMTAAHKTKPSASINRDATLRSVLDDFEKVVGLSPDMAAIYYNIGVVYIELNDARNAVESFTRAIALKPDFGEAYYNRGFVHYRSGNRTQGSADLSKAGELGVASSYNLLKRMTR